MEELVSYPYLHTATAIVLKIHTDTDTLNSYRYQYPDTYYLNLNRYQTQNRYLAWDSYQYPPFPTDIRSYTNNFAFTPNHTNIILIPISASLFMPILIPMLGLFYTYSNNFTLYKYQIPNFYLVTVSDIGVSKLGRTGVSIWGMVECLNSPLKFLLNSWKYTSWFELSKYVIIKDLLIIIMIIE